MTAPDRAALGSVTLLVGALVVAPAVLVAVAVVLASASPSSASSVGPATLALLGGVASGLAVVRLARAAAGGLGAVVEGLVALLGARVDLHAAPTVTSRPEGLVRLVPVPVHRRPLQRRGPPSPVSPARL